MDKGAEYGLLRYLLCAVGYVQKQNESKGNVHFFGLKDKEKDELFLSVVIVRFSKSKYYGTEIYFKEMEESTGPFYYANLETLNWLEENIPIPPNDFAEEWRKNSYEAILKESYNKKNKNIV